MKKIAKIIILALCIATYSSSSYNMLNPAIANTNLSIILLVLTIMAVVAFLFLIIIPEKTLAKWTLFGNRNWFLGAAIFLLLSLLIIVISTFIWDINAYPYILTHFSIIAILYLGNQYYNRKNSGKGQIVS